MTISNAAKRWVADIRAWNHRRTTEVYFVGYPKTGNTWTRFMLGRYVQLLAAAGEMPLFDEQDWLGRCVRPPVGPSMHFTHRPLLWEGQTADDLDEGNVVAPFLKKKVVLIARHPLDVLVSHWFQERHQVANATALDLREFIDSPVFGINKYLRFHGLWRDQSPQVDGFHLLRYEDTKLDPEASFRGLLEFLNIEVNNDVLASAIDYASFDNMKQMEASGNVPKYGSSGLKVFATGNASNENSYHVRKGKVGGYRDYLDAAVVRDLQVRIRQELGDWLGYGLEE